jgi:hypothetical protein
LPKQIPKNGTRRSRTSRNSETGPVEAAGSPGPLEKKTPSAPVASTSSRVADAGSTCTSTPRSAIRRGVIALMPRSTAATVKRRAPTAGTTYGSGVVTSPARSAPVIGGAARTTSTNSATEAEAEADAEADGPEKIPARIAPRSRRCRVTERVSTPLIPTTPASTSSSASSRRDRQLEARRAGSRTTYPATQMRRDSPSSSLTPVLPMCGAVWTTICRWYDGSVSVSWYPVMPVAKTASPTVVPTAP